MSITGFRSLVFFVALGLSGIMAPRAHANAPQAGVLAHLSLEQGEELRFSWTGGTGPEILISTQPDAAQGVFYEGPVPEVMRLERGEYWFWCRSHEGVLRVTRVRR